MKPPVRQFYSDNRSRVCPEAWAAMDAANSVSDAASYGDDSWTKRASDLIRQTFETDCDVYFVFIPRKNQCRLDSAYLCWLLERHRTFQWVQLLDAFSKRQFDGEAMEYTRIHRLLRLFTLIQGSAGLNAAKLAEICQTSERNIYRDIEKLDGAGIPISYDDVTHGYSIRRDFFLRPVDFALEEALAIILLGREIGQTEQIPHAAEAGKAIEKLIATLPANIREMVDELLPRMSVDLARTANEPTAEIYTIIRQAITDKRALQCTYESVSRNPTVESDRFRFDPSALYFGQRAWYAVGFHHGHAEVRTLKLARLVQCKSLDKPYFIPDDFSLDKHFGKAWRMMPSGTLHDIHLHFDAKMAETVADTHWHDSQDATFSEDGSLEIHFRVDGLEEIIWWILSYGPHCRVIEPAELRTRVAELHVKAATLYSSANATLPG